MKIVFSLKLNIFKIFRWLEFGIKHEKKMNPIYLKDSRTNLEITFKAEYRAKNQACGCHIAQMRGWTSL